LLHVIRKFLETLRYLTHMYLDFYNI